MFNIAVVNQSKNDLSNYLKQASGMDCSIYPIETENIESHIHFVDAILIKESQLEEIGKVCELIIRIRNLTNQFVWVLSEKTEKINRIVYLQLGVDGVFDAQIEQDELILYIQTALDRRKQALSEYLMKENSNYRNETKEDFVPIRLLPDNFSVCIEEKEEVTLTKLEFKALQILVKHAGQTVTYEEMNQALWGEKKVNKKYRILNLIFHLRKKLGDDPFNPKYIKTIRLKGYMLTA